MCWAFGQFAGLSYPKREVIRSLDSLLRDQGNGDGDNFKGLVEVQLCLGSRRH